MAEAKRVEAGQGYDEFARCPECGHATVGLPPGKLYINHAEGCSRPRGVPVAAPPAHRDEEERCPECGSDDRFSSQDGRCSFVATCEHPWHLVRERLVRAYKEQEAALQAARSRADEAEKLASVKRALVDRQLALNAAETRADLLQACVAELLGALSEAKAVIAALDEEHAG